MMWLPLVLLAVPSVMAGNALIYKILKLDPILFEHAGGKNEGLAAILLLLSVLGIGLAYWGYRGETSEPMRFHFAARILARKFYLDEMYAWMIRFFQDGLACLFDFIDKSVVDGIVARLPAAGAIRLGSVMRRLQSGNLQSYTFLFGLGVVLVIYLVVFR